MALFALLIYITLHRLRSTLFVEFARQAPCSDDRVREDITRMPPAQKIQRGTYAACDPTWDDTKDAYCQLDGVELARTTLWESKMKDFILCSIYLTCFLTLNLFAPGIKKF